MLAALVAVIKDNVSVMILHIEVHIWFMIHAAISKDLECSGHFFHRNFPMHAAERHRRDGFAVLGGIQMGKIQFFRKEIIGIQRRHLDLRAVPPVRFGKRQWPPSPSFSPV